MTAILIVDDAAFSRRMIRNFFKNDPYEILETSNGREALEMICLDRPDCILTKNNGFAAPPFTAIRSQESRVFLFFVRAGFALKLLVSSIIVLLNPPLLLLLESSGA